MGDVIELAYQHYSRHVIEKLVRAGYLLHSQRHKPAAVKLAWDRLKRDMDRTIASRNRQTDE